MEWTLPFISEENFTSHVKATIDKYGENWNHLILLGLIRI